MNLKSMIVAAGLAATVCAAEPAKSGINRADLDPTCKPCEDFWQYANGGWFAKNPIPARYPSWGTMSVINEANRERLRVILEAAQKSNAAAGSSERKVGDFHASCMDTAGIEALGTKPIEANLARVRGLQSPKDIAAALNKWQLSGAARLFYVVSDQDLKKSTDVIANVGGDGLSLPDRDYYFKDDERSKAIRDEFLKHVAAMMQLLGDAPEKAAAEAKTILAFETALAGATMTNVQRRDPYAQYHKTDLAGLSQMAPGFDWKALFVELQIPESSPINVEEPELMKKMSSQLASAPLEDWKTWLRWQIVSGAAEMLPKRFADESFRFNRTVLTGVKEQLPRWQTCANAVDRNLGDALGEVFVAKHFPPEAKKRMSELVENLRATLREELRNAAWLQPETRKNAVAKLNAFVAKIGYPDKWRDYTAVQVSPSAYYENRIAAAASNRAYQLAKIGKPVNRNDWGMTPPTVNAYYNSAMNEIAFPAGILQPPMFNMSADDAENYGAIAAVIGHEMGHGFDDQGSKFDAEGNLKNWWTPEDRKKFEERAECVIDQFNTIEVGDGLHHNGKLVVGEALGDLGGLTLAHKAYLRSLKGKEGPVLDGFTADQRFFLAFARVWGSQYRPEAVRLQLNTNPHPLAHFRAVGTLQNMPEFHKAFGCKEGDKMVRPAAKQCKLW